MNVYMLPTSTNVATEWDFNRNIHLWIAEHFPNNTILITQIAFKSIMLIAIFLTLNFLLRNTISPLINKIVERTSNRFLTLAAEHKVYKTLITYIALGLTYLCIDYIFFPYHPQSYGILATAFSVVLVLLSLSLGGRLLTTLERYYQMSYNYRGTAMVTLLQSVKLLFYILGGLVLIMILFKLRWTSILTTLGATTAILVLIFRDTLLGIISGFNIAISKAIKVGDWISIPKYNLEGEILEINLLTSKVKNFDMTISTIPTYDLINTEVKNMQVLVDSNSRRILRSIFFNVNSFKFMDEGLKQRWSEINLIKDYIAEMEILITQSKDGLPNSNLTINGLQLTNIGVFRVYVQKYLEQHPHIDRKNILLVRQKNITPQGLPLEIYCFTDTGKFVPFEKIQADIFDHILVASNYFDLEILQSKI